MKALGRALRVDLRRSVLSVTFLLSVGVLLLWMYLNCVETLNNPARANFNTVTAELYDATSSMGSLSPLLLAVAAITYAWSYCQDLSSGFLGQAAERVGLPAYGTARALTVGISAFLAFQLAMALFTGYLFSQGMPATARQSIVGPYTIISIENGFLPYYLCRATLSGLTCVLAAEFGLMLTAYLPNPHMAFILPLLAYYIVDMLMDTLINMFQLPLKMITPQAILFWQVFESPWLSFVWSAGWMLLLSVLCGRCFCGKVERGQKG